MVAIHDVSPITNLHDHGHCSQQIDQMYCPTKSRYPRRPPSLIQKSTDLRRRRKQETSCSAVNCGEAGSVLIRFPTLVSQASCTARYASIQPFRPGARGLIFTVLVQTIGKSQEIAGATTRSCSHPFPNNFHSLFTLPFTRHLDFEPRILSSI